MKPVKRHKAQADNTAHDCGVADSGGDHARSVAEDFRRGRTRGGHHESGSAQSEIATHELAERVGVLRFRVTVIGGQGAGLRVPAAVRELGRVQSGSAGAEIQTYSPGAIPIARRGDFPGESVLFQAQLCKAVDAAVIVPGIGAYAKIVQPPYPSNVGTDAGRPE